MFLALIVMAALVTARLFVPTVPHSWPMAFVALAHIYIGVLIAVLWQRRGRWFVGWLCLLVPTVLETALFVWAQGPALLRL